jgi:hypothetical protein
MLLISALSLALIIYKKLTEQIENNANNAIAAFCVGAHNSKGLEMDFSNFIPQSGIMGLTINEPSNNSTMQTASFNDENASWTYTVDSDPDPSYGISTTTDASLQEFFSRPVKVATYSWTVGQTSPFYESFNPWSLFFGNKRVVNRISNYNLLRAKLRVKFVINANGFFYGRLLASYLPLPNADGFTLDRALVGQDSIQASQRPHIYIDPTNSQGGEMILPFFWYNNYLSIPLSEWSAMGVISIRQLNNLQHANGATETINISVFVSAMDVHLAIPTSTDAGAIVPQSGEYSLTDYKWMKVIREIKQPKDAKKVFLVKFEDLPQKVKKPRKRKNVPPLINIDQQFVPQAGDEYGTGIISSPASVVQKAAGALTKAPMIGNYARATEIAAGAVKEMAMLFGFSRPTGIQPITEVVQRQVGNMATANLQDTSQKLTLDAKNETTIDPRTTGLSGADELDIVSLAKRQSYLTNFPWNVSTVSETLLWNSFVSPLMYDVDNVSEPTALHMTPSCWVSVPFRYWRGSMEFRFQVVCSNYHKGRLKIVYEPYFFGSTGEYNVQYVHIVDIADTTDFTVRVGWGNPKPFLKINTDYMYNAITGPQVPFGTVPTTVPTTDSWNGNIAVYVLNELTTPNSTVVSNVSVNVFTNMCDDFEVAVPTNDLMENFSYFQWQSGFEPQSGNEILTDKEETEQPSIPISTSVEQSMGPGLTIQNPLSAILFGEEVKSLRQLLKRYNLQRLWGVTIGTGGAYNINTLTVPVEPIYRGYIASGLDSVPSSVVTTSPIPNKPFNIVKTTHLSWIMPAFTGFRGSFRHKYSYNMSGANGNYTNITVARGEPNQSKTRSTIASPTINNPQAYSELIDVYTCTNSGAMALYAQQNNTLEVESPYYYFSRFKLAKNNNNTNLSTTAGTVDTLNLTWAQAFNDPSLAFFQDYLAVGEDFNLFFFTGAPLAYSYGPANVTPYTLP